jgi:large repetitive protein
VTFHVRVPDDVVATSDSGFLPIVGGASAVDTVAPTTAATQSPQAGWADWSKGPVTVHLAATDTGGSGVDSITYSASGAGAKPETIVHGDSADVVVSAEGATTLTFHATDAAGNAEAPQTLTIRIDDTGPGVTATISPSPNAAGWSNTPTTLTLHATDAASGVRSLTFDGVTADRDTVTISFGSAADDGVRTIRYHATDDLGNVGPEQTVTVRFDDLPPVVTAPRNGSWWVDATEADGAVVTYALGIQDNLDPSPAVDCDRPSGSLFPIGGDKVTCTVTDVAGNATTVVFWVDVRGAPDQIELELPVVGADSLNGLVSSAGRAARAGRTQEACNELNAYVHELNALTGKVIDPATAENRLETVGRVRTVLGCG